MVVVYAQCLHVSSIIYSSSEGTAYKQLVYFVELQPW
jgi:hypothetical protein